MEVGVVLLVVDVGDVGDPDVDSRAFWHCNAVCQAVGDVLKTGFAKFCRIEGVGAQDEEES